MFTLRHVTCPNLKILELKPSAIPSAKSTHHAQEWDNVRTRQNSSHDVYIKQFAYTTRDIGTSAYLQNFRGKKGMRVRAACLLRYTQRLLNLSLRVLA